MNGTKRKFFILFFLFLFAVFCIPSRAYAAGDLNLHTTKQPGNMVKLDWTAWDGAQRYVIYVSVGNNRNYTRKAEVSAESENTYICKGISKKKTYYFKVEALGKAVDEESGTQVLTEEAVKLYNGNIVSTTHQKYTYTEMKKDIALLEEKYSDYVQVEIIGKTADKRNIYDVILGNPEASKCVIFQASIHGREYMTSQLVMEQMEYYLDYYNKTFEKESYHDIFDRVCVHVVPMANPDGVTISQSGFKGIRNASLRKKLKKMIGSRYPKNWKANARGVDLNNQFDHNFVYVKRLRKGSYAGYGGKKPVSEKESKALVNLVKQVKPKAVVNYHAMGNVIYCRYGASKKMQKKVYRLSGKIRKLTGYSYMGLTDNAGFANWLVCEEGIPSCTVEIGRNVVPVPIKQFKTIWKKNKNVMAAAAKLYE